MGRRAEHRAVVAQHPDLPRLPGHARRRRRLPALGLPAAGQRGAVGGAAGRGRAAARARRPGRGAVLRRRPADHAVRPGRARRRDVGAGRRRRRPAPGEQRLGRARPRPRGHGAVPATGRPPIEPTADGGWTVRAGEHTITAQYVVNAAGGWAGEVAALAGLDVPVVHSRRNVYSSAPGALPTPAAHDRRLQLRGLPAQRRAAAALRRRPPGRGRRLQHRRRLAVAGVAARTRRAPLPVAGRRAAGPLGLLGRHVREHARPSRHPRPRPVRARPGSTPAGSPATG